MSNITITNVDQGNVVLSDAQFGNALLTFAAGGTVKEGTILARDSVSKKLVPYVKGGTTNENGIPKAVLTYDVESADAGDVSIRYLKAGTVRFERLIIAADGDNTNVDADVRDQLRDYSIVVEDVAQLAVLDNQ